MEDLPSPQILDDEDKKRLEMIGNKRIDHPINVIIIGAVAFGMANCVVFLWLQWFSLMAPAVVLSTPKVIGTSELCPGDLLSYSFSIDTTRTTQVEITVYARSDFINRRSGLVDQVIYQIEGDSLLNVTRVWMVPPYWGNPENPNPEKWQPGPYHLEILANVTGQSPRGEPLTVPFTISRSCIEVRSFPLPQPDKYVLTRQEKYYGNLGSLDSNNSCYRIPIFSFMALIPSNENTYNLRGSDKRYSKNTRSRFSI